MPHETGPHRRYDPLRDEWVLVSPQRAKRPWQGATESPPEPIPSYDPVCYLCPGNVRAGDQQNPGYTSTYTFVNDFPALLPAPGDSDESAALFQSRPVTGECRVLCFSPDHSKTLATLSDDEMRQVIAEWQAQSRELGARYAWVQIFENRGASMGMSSPHPHGQVWAMDQLPSIVAREDDTQRRYMEQHGEPMLSAVAREELLRGERVVEANADWVMIVPYWAVWPFETLLLPMSPTRRLENMHTRQAESLADILQKGLARYDRLFGVPFPYSMGWHFAPYVQGSDAHWQLHAHFYPPLLRSASVRKFMVGFEMLSEPQRDMTPEEAAERLRRA